jgi:hypothetical protein
VGFGLIIVACVDLTDAALLRIVFVLRLVQIEERLSDTRGAKSK